MILNQAMKSAIQRVITGILLAGIMIGSVLMGIYGFLLLILAINFLGLKEFYQLFRSETIYPRVISGILLASALVFTSFLVVNGITDLRVLLILIPLSFSIYVIELYLKAENPFLNLAITFLGVLCISLPLSFFLLIAFLPFGSVIYHAEIIIGIFVILWAGDSGAFFFGKLFGKRLLFHRISPNKTWEGSLGGAFSALAASFIMDLLDPVHRLQEWIIMAVIIMVTGTYGDFIKSLMKRSLHVKDSGTILPGHGGILDRFDTLLGSAPFIFGYLILYGHG